jgi:hypothetical protein
MSNVKLGITNFLVSAQSAGLVLKNGTGGGAPALFELAPWTMAKLLHHDRYDVWRSGDLAIGSYDVDFTFGADKTIDTVAFCGYRTQYGTVSQIEVFTQTGAYTPGGTWTSRGVLDGTAQGGGGLGLRDDWIEFSAITCRSVRFEFSVSVNPTSFTLGNFYACDVTDLGGIYSRGGSRSIEQIRSELEMPSGVTIINQRGLVSKMFSFPWNACPTAVRTAFILAQLQPYPALLIDEIPAVYEVFMRAGKLTDALVFGSTYDVNVEFVGMP